MSLMSGCFILNFAHNLQPIRILQYMISIDLRERKRVIRVGYPSGRFSLAYGMTRTREGIQQKFMRKLQPHKNYPVHHQPLDTIHGFSPFVIFQGDSGEEASIGSIEGLNGNGSDKKREKVRSLLLLSKK